MPAQLDFARGLSRAPKAGAGHSGGLLPAGRTLGAQSRRVAAGPLVVVGSVHPAGDVLPRHEHAGAYLCLTAAGSYRQWASAKSELECERGSLVVHPAGHAHANQFGANGARCVNLHLAREAAEEGALSRLLGEYRQLRVTRDVAAMARLERELDARDDAAELGVCSAAYELLAWLARQKEPHGPARWVRDVVDLIEADLTANHSLRALAAVAGVHPAHLARTFSARRGETVGEYVRRRRLEEADALVARTTRPIAEIAVDAGFCDQAHFTRAYRRHFGETPARRRRDSCPKG